MILSYRTRRNIRRTSKFLIIFALVATFIWLLWMIWIARFMIYDRDLGARLDFGLGAFPEGQLAAPPTQAPKVDIIYKEPQIDLPNVEEDVKESISGYYIDMEQLSADIPGAKAKLEALAPGTAVMIDVKSPKGYFYYSSELDEAADSTLVDIAQMNELIDYLVDSDLYLIARLPAFRDRRYGLNNQPCGLPVKDGDGSLWMDEGGCFWMNPTNDKILNYLVRITKELQSMGFDEVVYDEFRFPDTDQFAFDGDQAKAIADAAATLATACATEQLCVSFVAQATDFVLPAGNCRVYFQGIDAENAETVAEQVMTDNPVLHVLFITTSSNASDTRFEKYCVLRPLESAH